MTFSTKPVAKTAPEIIWVDDISVFLTRKKIKNMNMRVKPPDGRVEVSAPLRMPLTRIKAFIREKAGWIRAQQQRMASIPEDDPAYIAEHATSEEREEWKQVVSACVPPLIAEWEKIMGVKAGKLAYRDMKSRWGSCQPSTGRICINTRLALYPPECLEYVVVHELCHLKERGHGSRFYALMDKYMPDWKSRRAQLR